MIRNASVLLLLVVLCASCAAPRPDERRRPGPKTVKEVFERPSPAVFLGDVTRIRGRSGLTGAVRRLLQWKRGHGGPPADRWRARSYYSGREVVFKIVATWGGAMKNTVVLVDPEGDGCAPTFEPGREYLVFAERDGDDLYVDCDSLTRARQESEKLLAELGTPVMIMDSSFEEQGVR